MFLSGSGRIVQVDIGLKALDVSTGDEKSALWILKMCTIWRNIRLIPKLSYTKWIWVNRKMILLYRQDAKWVNMLTNSVKMFLIPLKIDFKRQWSRKSMIQRRYQVFQQRQSINDILGLRSVIGNSPNASIQFHKDFWSCFFWSFKTLFVSKIETTPQ